MYYYHYYYYFSYLLCVIFIHSENKVDEALPHVRAELVHHPEIVVYESASSHRIARHIPRVGVAVCTFRELGHFHFSEKY